MKAAVLTGPKSVQIEERDVPKPCPGDVVIRVHTCGVCGTDSHIYEGQFLVRFPVVPGHELAGTVVDVGTGVRHVRVGDRVTVDPNIVCGVCRFCRDGLVNLCADLTAVGVNRDGGFAEYCLAPATQVYRLPKELSLEAGAFAEPVACCLHGLDRCGAVAGDRVLVLGGGAIGQIMVQLCRTAGARQIIVSEPIAARRELALHSGADTVLDPSLQDVRTVVAELTNGGADLVIECSGTTAALEQGLACARRGGRVLLFGVAHQDAVASIRPYDVFIRELSVFGSFVNPFTHERAITALASGRVRPEALITHRFGVEQFEDALRASRSRDAIKVVVQPGTDEV
ncbi:MAG: zinc-dependent alcohol dehydrogenase family protein [Armatimonadota bacterium]